LAELLLPPHELLAARRMLGPLPATLQIFCVTSFQNTNTISIRLGLQVLATTRAINVVGDDDQSTTAGAAGQSRKHPAVPAWISPTPVLVKLEQQNYRFDQVILKPPTG